MVKLIHVSISSHGYGHAAQTCLIVNALRQYREGLAFTIETAVPHAFLAARINGPFQYRQQVADPGLVMASSLRVLARESLDAYVAWFANREENINSLTARLHQKGIALALTNIAFDVPLAAQRVGIPSVGFCSLNWADVFGHYCGVSSEAHAIHAQLRSAYSELNCFLRLTPAMPMSWLSNSVSTPPVSRIGMDRRERLLNAFGMSGQDVKIILAGFGGIDTPLPLARWPAAPGLVWLIATRGPLERTDMRTLDDVPISFIDAVASCDLIITKAGYGTFTEAGFAKKPVVYVKRGDWPEEPYLVDWLTKYVPARQISSVAFDEGKFLDEVKAICDLPVADPYPESGHQQIVDNILRYL